MLSLLQEPGLLCQGSASPSPLPTLTTSPPARAGWDVRGAVRRVWSGERHLGSLLDGKDAGTQLAIKAIHFYSLQNDKKMGRQTYSAS